MNPFGKGDAFISVQRTGGRSVGVPIDVIPNYIRPVQ